MGDDFLQIWVYLASEPLLALTMTLVAYQLGLFFYERAGRSPYLNPVLIAVVVLVLLLIITDTSYATYFDGAQFVHFLLGPATVALAVPLYRSFALVRRSWVSLSVALFTGAVFAALSTIALATLSGAEERTILSLAPRSVTSGIAMGISERLGGLPSLTAVCVILGGIVGAMLGPPLMNLVRIRDWQARGFAMGLASHGIGTARAMQVNQVAGAFAGLAMGLNALATALLLPVLLGLWRSAS